jgi:hypothetical protein
MAIDKAL